MRASITVCKRAARPASSRASSHGSRLIDRQAQGMQDEIGRLVEGIARAVAVNEPGRAKAACRIAQPIPHGYQLEFRCHCRSIPPRRRRKPLRNQEPRAIGAPSDLRDHGLIAAHCGCNAWRVVREEFSCIRLIADFHPIPLILMPQHSIRWPHIPLNGILCRLLNAHRQLGSPNDGAETRRSSWEWHVIDRRIEVERAPTFC